MDDLEFIVLLGLEEDEWQQVGELMQRMYESMQEQGLMLPLADDGAAKWIATTRNTAEKFGRLAVAKHQGEVVAFAHGMIKFMPDYLGGQPTGVISHVYVDPGFRDKQVGSRLVSMLEDWFRGKNVDSIELQVIHGNPGAMDFWKNMGYGEELVQYRKFLK